MEALEELQVLKVPVSVNHLVFKNGIRIKHVEEIGFTSDGRFLTVEKDRVGNILAISLS